MKLSVVIVNYNVKYYLEQCIRSVTRALEGIDGEVIVVDNLSTDGSVDYFANYPGITFIANRDNVGFSKANNQAIRQARGEYILLLNPDTVIGESSLRHCCRFMDEHPDAGGVGVKMIDGYGRFLPESKRGFPSPWNSFCRMSGLSRLFPQSRLFARYHLRYLDEKAVHMVDVLAGAFMLLRRETLDQIGLLDETFFMYGEDIDLSYRIVQGGYKNYYLPIPIIHYKGESTKKDIRYVRNFYEAMLIFYNKHYPNSGYLIKGIIRLSIKGIAGLSALRKMIFDENRKANNRQQEVLIDTAQTTFDRIIDRMDTTADKSKLYTFYYPDLQLSINANEIRDGVSTPR